MDHRCKCCGPDETPAEDCPDLLPCFSSTVTISFSISPKSCYPLESITPVACEGFCGGKVKGCDCSQLSDLFAPLLGFGGSGYVDAKWWQAWHTHYITSGSPCSGTEIPCGGDFVPFTDLLSGTVSGTVSGSPITLYYPNFDAHADPEQSSVAFTISPVNCEACECDGLAPWCSRLNIQVYAKFVINGVPVRTFGYGGSPLFLCACGDDDNLALDFPVGITAVNGIWHQQSLVADYERRILASQTHCGLSSGVYACRSATWTNDSMKVWVPGLWMLEGSCALGGGLVDGGPYPGNDVCEGSTTCGKGSMADAGFNLVVEVA